VIYTIRFSDEAEKDFARLDQTMRRRVIDRLELLSASPHNPRLAKVLKGSTELRSSRIGSWRILFKIRQKDSELEIITIRPRGQAYRNL
jgi:mRNA interferase RelE/StbE